ncbi:MAG: ABC transporter substrate-binding protein [Caldilineaceae bacterium]|nr:ABC transporter substrate-binding protein [Caldilineaceae bacterium]
MKSKSIVFHGLSLLMVLSLLLSACSSAAPAAPAPSTEGSTEQATTSTEAAASSGLVLTDKPADAGERPVQMAVYNSPADYEAATGEKIEAYGEAPELAEAVASGDLPPVEERLPAEPVVVKPEEAIGKYGGIMQMAITGQNTVNNEAGGYFTIEPLTIHSPQGEIIPNVATGWEWSDDYKTLVLQLRQGIKWSDGVPFTADDIMFWWEDIVLNTELTPTPHTLLTRGGELAELTKIDDYTIQFSFAEPYALFTTYLGSWGFPRADLTSNPKHYLTQFHPKYTDLATLEPLMEADGFDTWIDFFRQKNSVNNPDRPTISAWIPQELPPQPVQVHKRNPYYWKVDSAGNQLPYIGELRHTRTADTEATLLKVIAGDLDFVGAGSTNLSILAENKESGDYRFAYADWMPNAFCNIMFNFNSPDPVKKELYNDVRFRRALSVAINRDEIIKLIYKGGVFASQVAPLRGEPYHGESELFQSYAQFDPDLANQLLDEIGLTERDGEGYRLGPDGNELLLIIYATTAWPAETPEVMEIVKGHWAKVGIKATVTPEAGELWGTRHNAGEHDISSRGAHFGGGPVHPTLNGNTFALSGWQWAPEWAKWLDTEGAEGVEPPDDVKKLREIREQILGEPDEAVRNALMQEVFEIHMNNLWSIGIVVDDPRFGQMKVVKNRLRNVVTWSISGEWYPMVPAQWFINE